MSRETQNAAEALLAALKELWFIPPALRVDIADVVACFRRWQTVRDETSLSRLESALTDLVASWRAAESAKALQDDPVERSDQPD